MSKSHGFGKFVMFCAATAAAAAGIYYYLNKKNSEFDDDLEDDDFDDFDDFDDADIDDSSSDERGYVNLDRASNEDDTKEDKAGESETEEFFDDEK